MYDSTVIRGRREVTRCALLARPPRNEFFLGLMLKTSTLASRGTRVGVFQESKKSHGQERDFEQPIAPLFDGLVSDGHKFSKNERPPLFCCLSERKMTSSGSQNVFL